MNYVELLAQAEAIFAEIRKQMFSKMTAIDVEIEDFLC